MAGLNEGGQGGEAVFVVNGEGHGILVEELEDGWNRVCRGGVDDNLGGHGGFWGGVVSGQVGGVKFYWGPRLADEGSKKWYQILLGGRQPDFLILYSRTVDRSVFYI